MSQRCGKYCKDGLFLQGFSDTHHWSHPMTYPPLSPSFYTVLSACRWTRGIVSVDRQKFANYLRSWGSQYLTLHLLSGLYSCVGPRRLHFLVAKRWKKYEPITGAANVQLRYKTKAKKRVTLMRLISQTQCGANGRLTLTHRWFTVTEGTRWHLYTPHVWYHFQTLALTSLTE